MSGRCRGTRDASRRSPASPIRWSRTSARCIRRSIATRPGCSSPRGRSSCATRSRAAGRSTCSPTPRRRPASERIGALAARDQGRRRHGARSLGAGAGEDHPPRQSAERGRRLPASASRRSPRSAATASGWRSTGCAIPAISAPSSAPPTRPASPAWRWSAPSCDPFGLEAVRATMGSIFHVPVARTGEDGLIAQAKRHGARLVGTHLTARRVDYREADYRPPLILLMGNEQQGLTREARRGLRRAGAHPDARTGGFAQSRGLDGADDLRGAARRTCGNPAPIQPAAARSR